MIVGLLSICTIASLGESLGSNLKRPIKCLTLNNQYVNLDQYFLM